MAGTGNINATEHHQFYGSEPGLPGLAFDASGNANCTAGATWMYQSAFAYGYPCTVMVGIALEAGVHPAGYIFARYSGTTRMGIRWNGSNGFQLVVNNAVARTLSTVSDGYYVFHWSMAEDPLNPGNVVSEVRCWDQTTGYQDGVTWSHTAPTLAGTDIIWGAQVTAGTNTTGGALFSAGYLLHDTSHLQVRRDMVIAPAAPALEGETAIEVPMPDALTVWGEQDSVAGPVHWVAADAVAANRLLLGSPLVNLQWDSPEAFDTDTISAHPWWIPAPSGSGYVGLPFTWRRPVPLTFNRVRVRVYFRGVFGASSAVLHTYNLTVYSCSRRPDSDEPMTVYSDTQGVGPINDWTTGPGRWIEFDSVRVARTEDNSHSWFAVGFDVDPGVGEEFALFHVHAVVIEPLSVEDTDAIAEIGVVG